MVRFGFAYTGLRVRDLDGAIKFFTNVLDMQLLSRVEAPWNQGAFAHLGFRGETHTLELNYYGPDSPHYTEFSEGDQLDHLGVRVDDFDAALAHLARAGYPVTLGPFHVPPWHIAFVKAFDGIWLDVFKKDPTPEEKRRAEKATVRPRRTRTKKGKTAPRGKKKPRKRAR